MELPLTCRETLETMISDSGTKPAVLAESVRRMSRVYKEESGRGARLITKKEEVLAYAVTRMPATFGAVSSALIETLSALPADTVSEIRTVLDLGAGTGAASLAITETLPAVQSISAIEREGEMLSLGSRLTSAIPGVTVAWEKQDALSALRARAAEGSTYDLVILSYMTNELSDGDRAELFSLLPRVTGKLLLLIEPGTKAGFSILYSARQSLCTQDISLSVCAPCPENAVCPMTGDADGDDWCHFTCRVARSRLHRQLKEGDVPYEDEKYAYLALTRTAAHPCHARILRHPQKDPGRISLVLCTPEGMKTETVTKRDKERFTKARKATAGDTI